MVYKRDYKREYELQKKRGENGTGHNSGNAERHRLRRKAIKEGMISADSPLEIDHKKALVKGGSNSLKNARAVSRHENRSFPRNKKAGMISNT